ncbi:MAG: hypothetical protein N3D72_02495, partial [Candidatus Methanomethyliaceae archaeon]|nr:hypothetical protein [Candidatus Methanomethyliaceae archaeon]
MLPERKQEDLLSSFIRFLNSIPSTIKIVMLRSKRGIELGNGRIATIEHPTFYLDCREPMDEILEFTKFLFQPISSIPIPKVKEEKWNHLILEDGRLAKVFTIYELPAILPVGFLSEVYDIADMIQFKITPIPSEEASRKLERYKMILNALISASISKRKSPPQSLLIKRNMAEATLSSVMAGISKLFKISTILVIFASSMNELKEKTKLLQNRLAARLIRIDSPKFFQGSLYYDGGKRLYAEGGTVSAFYPFMAGEIIESGGIFLGVNLRSGAPIIYNPLIRHNLNISIV